MLSDRERRGERVLLDQVEIWFSVPSAKGPVSLCLSTLFHALRSLSRPSISTLILSQYPLEVDPDNQTTLLI